MSSAIATIAVNASVERGVKVACLEFSNQVVQALASRYGFDAEEAIRELSLEAISVARATGAKRAAGEKKPKAAKAARMVPEIPLPFCGAKGDWCAAIRLNHGLYTQCTNEISDKVYCKTCQKQADANANGKPNFGNVQDRSSVGPMDYVDPHGRKVVSYSSVMSKLKIERAAAEAEAARFGWTIDASQFEAAAQKKRGRPKSVSDSDSDDSEKVKKSRGRPRKNKEIGAATNVADDLLAAMLEQAKLDDSQEEADSSEELSENDFQEAAKAAEKEAAEKEAAKAAEKEAAKAAKAAEKEAAKAAKAAEKEAAKAAKAAEKAAEKEAAKAAKAAEKAAEKAEGKKAGKPAAAKAAEPVAVVAVPVHAAAAAAELSEEQVEEEEEEDDEEQLVLRRKTHKGKNYYVCEKNNIYDPETQEIIGVWNTETNAPEIDA
jgi:chemotaxis protein histidine kinase CheA